MKVLAVMLMYLGMIPGLHGLPRPVGAINMGLNSVSENSVRCDQCKLILSGVQALSNAVSPHFNAEAIFSRLCVILMPLFGQNSITICPDLMKMYLPEIRNIILNDILHGACEVLGICPASNLADDSPQWITQSTSFLTPEHSELTNEDLTTFQANKQGSEPLTFVQISDIHLDRAYTKNAPIHCGYTICCRSNITGNGSAGAYGHYNCDAAETTVTALLDYIRNLKPAPAFFVYVGDSSPHALHDTLENKLTDNLLVNSLLTDKLRGQGQIFTALGNHEMYPTSVYSRSLANTQAILQSLSEQWPSMFNVKPDQMLNIRKHAFYTALIMPGLRILTTNSMYDCLYNIYAFKSQLDPVVMEHRQFVRQTLLDARRNNEKVIYVSHMKPSPFQTYPSYADEYEKLVADFSDVLILQLFGHEHADVFLLNRDPANQRRITGVSLAAPSMTTYFGSNAGVNPSFRLFKLDPSTFELQDYDQFYIDIVKANEKGIAEVKKHYTFTEEYNVPDMTPGSFENISERIQTNWTDFQKFEANYYVLAKDRPACSESDILCRRHLTCQTREPKPLGFAKCLLGQ